MSRPLRIVGYQFGLHTYGNYYLLEILHQHHKITAGHSDLKIGFKEIFELNDLTVNN